jgi:hypothetical protein
MPGSQSCLTNSRKMDITKDNNLDNVFKTFCGTAAVEVDKAEMHLLAKLIGGDDYREAKREVAIELYDSLTKWLDNVRKSTGDE